MLLLQLARFPATSLELEAAKAHVALLELLQELAALQHLMLLVQLARFLASLELEALVTLLDVLLDLAALLHLMLRVQLARFLAISSELGAATALVTLLAVLLAMESPRAPNCADGCFMFSSAGCAS